MLDSCHHDTWIETERAPAPARDPVGEGQR
jgi:hypothetical protein